jgi:hypothetical protein
MSDEYNAAFAKVMLERQRLKDAVIEAARRWNKHGDWSERLQVIRDLERAVEALEELER